MAAFQFQYLIWWPQLIWDENKIDDDRWTNLFPFGVDLRLLPSLWPVEDGVTADFGLRRSGLILPVT